jgi:hypothetical protein
MMKLAKKKKRPDVDKIKVDQLTPYIGKIVRFYENGWRFWKLTAIEDNTALLENPIVGKRQHKLDIKYVEPNPWAK